MSFKKWLSVGGQSSNEKEQALSTSISTSNALGTSSGGSKQINEVISQSPLVEDGHSGSITQDSQDSTVFPGATVDLPFGDGSDKIFGIENFGNTCYCNSILQCLYYTDDFRIEILKNPVRKEERRQRRRNFPGKTPHYAIAESIISSNDESKELPKEKSTLARRTSNFFGRSKRNASTDDETEAEMNGSTNGNSNSNSNSNSNNSNASSTTYNSTPMTSTVVITIPNIRAGNMKILIGRPDPSNPTIDARKKQALTEGPVLNVDHSLVDYGMKESLFTSLKDIFEVMTEADAKMGVVSPSHLIITLKKENELFRSTMHQDAHEFFNFLLNDVIDTISSHLRVHKNGFHDIFEGFLTNQTKCLTCENVTSRDETFLDLSVDLRDNESIENCLRQFSASEMLAGSNKFYCDCCHSLQEAEKRMGIRNFPRVLSLHLKRFKYSENLDRNVKLFHKVSYQLYLKLKTDFPSSNPEDDWKFYQLYGVVVHIGGGPHHGHYVALVKTKTEGWLLFDDETVEKIDEDFVLRFVGGENEMATAYVLFYQQISHENYVSGILAEQLRKSKVETETTVITPSVTVTNSPQIQGKISQPLLNPKFSFDENVNTRLEGPNPSHGSDISPLDKLTRVCSIGQSLDSSQKSSASSEKTCKPDEKSKDSKLTTIKLPSIARFKSKSSITQASSSPTSTPVPASQNRDNQIPTLSIPEPVAQPTPSSSFWKRDQKKSEAISALPTPQGPDDKQKKKRMSMSFSFKKT